jgi:hypothetical protein
MENKTGFLFCLTLQVSLFHETQRKIKQFRQNIEILSDIVCPFYKNTFKHFLPMLSKYSSLKVQKQKLFDYQFL